MGPLCRAAGKVSAPRGWQTSTHGSVWTADSGSKVSPTPHPQVSGPVTGETSFPVCRPTGFRGLLPFNGSKPYPRAGSRVEPACSPTGYGAADGCRRGDRGCAPLRSAVAAGRACLWSPVMGQPASRPRSLTSRTRCSARRRASAVVTMSSWSPRRSGVLGVGTNPLSSRTTRVTLAPGGQPQLEHLDAVQVGRGPDLHLQQRRRPSPPAGWTRPRRRAVWAASLTPSRRATQGRVGALHEGEDHHEDEDEVEQPLDPRRTGGERHGGEHDRHGAAQARPRTGTPARATAPGTGSSTRPPTPAGPAAAAPGRCRAPAGCTASGWPGWPAGPSRTNSPIWASQPRAWAKRRGRPGGAAAGCCPAPAPPGTSR